MGAHPAQQASQAQFVDLPSGAAPGRSVSSALAAPLVNASERAQLPGPLHVVSLEVAPNRTCKLCAPGV